MPANERDGDYSFPLDFTVEMGTSLADDIFASIVLIWSLSTAMCPLTQVFLTTVGSCENALRIFEISLDKEIFLP